MCVRACVWCDIFCAAALFQNQAASSSKHGDADENGFDLEDQYVGLPESQQDVFLCARWPINQ